MQDIKSTTEKHAPVSRAISMVMRIRWYGAKHITQYGRSRATLNNTGHHHWASIGPVLPLRTPWSLILGVVALWKLLPEASAQKARNRPSTQLIKATSCVERLNATMEAEELS